MTCGQRGSGVRLWGVGKRFADAAVLDDVSLEIAPGELLFLLGPSGAGKTTLLRIIGGYDHPTRGTVEVSGEDVTRLPAHRRNIGMVFQNYALFPHMTVGENVAFGLRMRRLPRHEIVTRVGEAMELVALTGLERRYPRQLSGGQQQRVALARAVVYRPSVLLLDEPLANLDRRLRDAMRVELTRLQRRLGITTIMVTHDQEESLAMADRVAVIHEGRLQQVGAPVEIYTRPASPFVAGFIGEMNVLAGKVRDVRGGVCLVDCDGLEVPVREPETGAGREVTVCIRAEQLTLAPLGGPAGAGTFEATVQFVTYLGAATLSLIRPDAGPVLRVLEPNAAGRIARVVGERVRATWPAEHTFCFPRGGD